jgi:hypothetical protein
LETIVAGRTGVFFKEQTVESLAGAIDFFETGYWHSGVIRQHAERFRRERFLQRMESLVHTRWMTYQRDVHHQRPVYA